MWIREQEDWDAVDVPEMTDEDFAPALPFEQAFPDLARSLKKQGGRPKLERPKVKVACRLAADVVDAVKASGKASNARVEQILRDAIAKGAL